MNIPTIAAKSVPFINTQQMIEVDRAMIEEYRISLMQMMENAGRNLAHLVRERFFDGDPRGKTAVILAGTGGNGGGALVCARRLHNYGAEIRVAISKSTSNFTPTAAHQLGILQQMGIPIAIGEVIGDEADLIIDGLIGYSLHGDPRGAAGELIRWANAHPAPILALDTPSGLDAASGIVYEPVIRAMATMTLALPKKGMWTNPNSYQTAVSQIGELYLADISVPPALYANPALGLSVGHIFATSDIVRLQ